MRNLTTIIMLCMGFMCHASPKPKDSIYTNVEALMKEVRTTKKQTATYYMVLKDGDDKEVKVRVDLKKMDADIPLYKSGELDIKKLLALKEESLEAPMKKFAEFKVKLDEWKSASNEVKTLKAEIKSLKTGDSLSWDTESIDSIQGIIDQKELHKDEKDKEYNDAFNEYEKVIGEMLGELKSQYNERLSSAIEEAYHKLENTETVFLSAQDAPIWHDVRINLIKLDARRPMKVTYVAREAKTITENISVGKFYYILHFAEFGIYFPDKVQAIIDQIKEKEVKLNPYLIGERFALVCDDQDRTQDHIYSVMNPWDYDVEKEETEPKPKPGDPLVEMEIVHNYSAQNSGGKFGCSRVGSGCEGSSIPNLPKFAENEKVHGGVDLYCDLNTKVYSMFDGVVEKVVDEVIPNAEGNLGDFGNRVRIKSTSKEHIDNGKVIYVYYTHLNQVEKLKVGDTVKQGQLLGLSGKTGNAHNIPAWRYHTHISIYEGSTAGKNRVNPINYFTTKNLSDKNN